VAAVVGDRELAEEQVAEAFTRGAYHPFGDPDPRSTPQGMRHDVSERVLSI
jgi:hypothetical protein